MKYSWKIYIILGIVFVSSILLSLYLPTTDILRELSSFPAIVALVGVIYQIFKDQSAFERQLLLQQSQNHFMLGASSHMANVAFDKHVAFCEECITEMHQIVSELFTKGPSPIALTHAAKLYRIQQKYTTWLTPAIFESINKFEQTLMNIGADANYVEKTIETGDPGRGPAIERIYSMFKDVLEIGNGEDREVNKEIAIR